MDKALTRMSRLLAVSAVASIVFGATVLLWPGISLLSLTLLFGAFAFVYGTFAIASGLYLLTQRSTEWVPYVVGGVAGVIIGVITYLHPGLTDLTLVYIVAAWAFVIGVFEVVAAIDMRGTVPGAAWMGLAGALSVVFGIVVAFRPGAGMLAILWVIGFYGILAGVTRLVAAYRIHQFHGDVKAVAAAMRPTQA
ncbi:MAG TPA: DUF308 domain-containing protein [Candidatus Udaeobacter sp.]|nr:DUF308 domain-containing protein [Candidatus Udaeobacter sp.]